MSMCVIGRAEKMGLGSMTEDFCNAMHPDKIIIMNMGNGRHVETGRLPPSEIIDVRHWRADSQLVRDKIQGCDYIVGFESLYREDMTTLAHSVGAKTVLFPMWEWAFNMDADLLLCLSDTDMAHNSQRSIRVDWPGSPATHDPERIMNWPPLRFVHLAGNAQHNRDSTREVLEAARYLDDTNAILYVYHSFDIRKMFDHPLPDCVKLCGQAETRKQLLDQADVLVCPRGLPGHSLPINEATGEGIPCIVMDLPDWAVWPYRVPRKDSTTFKARGVCSRWTVDPRELGEFMQQMALGNVPLLSEPQLPTWGEFRLQWDRWLSNL